MYSSTSINVFIALAFVLANLPWFSPRFLFVIVVPKKRFWQAAIEWLIFFLIMGLIASIMEKKPTGEVHSQDWEFYAVNAVLFAVFAVPGFIWHVQLKKVFKR